MKISTNKILYIPLDERPCNYTFPQYIAAIGSAQLCLPPRALLGKFKQPANVDALWDWVFAQADQASYLVLSMDMLLYGGIVPSRLHHLDEAVFEARRARLHLLRSRFPTAQIYAFQLITRAPARNGSGEEPDYYEAHGYDIFRYGVIADRESLHKHTSEETQEKEAILQRVPTADLQDFLHRREINFSNNMQMLQLTANNVVDYFVIPLDDCFSYGYASAERRRLADAAAQLGVLAKISLYPGADEMGCTLVARALCHLHHMHPRIWTDYSSANGRLTTPPYEDRSICETAPHHILCAGAREAFSPDAADIALMINPPTAFSNRIKFELDRRKLYFEPERNLNAFLARMEQHLSEERICAVADCAVPDGADECLMQFLSQQQLLSRVHCFSGWNTSSNAMGTAVAHAVALACTRKLGTAQGNALQLSRVFCTLRCLEDWGYMTHVRQTISEQITAGIYSGVTDVRYLGAQTDAVSQEITRLLHAFAREHIGSLPFEFHATLPWQRTFEIDLVLTQTSKN